MSLGSQTWMGPAYLGLGLALLGVQVYVYVSAELLSSLLIGGGLGSLLLGGIAWFHSYTDRRSGALDTSQSLPTAEEYEAQFHETQGSSGENCPEPETGGPPR